MLLTWMSSWCPPMPTMSSTSSTRTPSAAPPGGGARCGSHRGLPAGASQPQRALVQCGKVVAAEGRSGARGMDQSRAAISAARDRTLHGITGKFIHARWFGGPNDHERLASYAVLFLKWENAPVAGSTRLGSRPVVAQKARAQTVHPGRRSCTCQQDG